MSIRIQRPRCWPCTVYPRQCYDEVTAHTWMDDEDAKMAGLSWPLTAEQKAANQCACECAGGPGGCEVLP